ncbi:putative negative regulator of RcsB-dependent stress response [Chitinivorax tropicus]|uniref:Ancillary SecYEG translocon subunit n=1 Tax=Chitinivorax tropicus TaxID=714531 RepID=A0A840MQS7_9PROT|nr:tetratricopeptide repeat protein [Chitinivorax tropicus]MBB5019785.1 putative negative regulator of RcsB-dependent stress response [Chitinivorax tropicus]
MAYDLQEQEQLDSLKSFWKQYGGMIMAVTSAAIIALVASQAWRHYQDSRAQAASTEYTALEQALQKNDQAKAKEFSGRLASEYSKTPYAARAALLEAKQAFDKDDLKTATAKLSWVVENAVEPEIKDVARLRLAAVQLDQKQFDAALKALDAAPVDAFSSQFAEMKGDVLLAQGKKADAAKAYQHALNKLEKTAPGYQLVQMKLDALGDVK